MPADIEGVLGWSHPGGRNSNAGMAISRSGQLGKLLDKATDIVPATVALLQLLEAKFSFIIILLFHVNILIGIFLLIEIIILFLFLYIFNRISSIIH